VQGRGRRWRQEVAFWHSVNGSSEGQGSRRASRSTARCKEGRRCREEAHWHSSFANRSGEGAAPLHSAARGLLLKETCIQPTTLSKAFKVSPGPKSPQPSKEENAIERAPLCGNVKKTKNHFDHRSVMFQINNIIPVMFMAFAPLNAKELRTTCFDLGFMQLHNLSPHQNFRDTHSMCKSSLFPNKANALHSFGFRSNRQHYFQKENKCSNFRMSISIEKMFPLEDWREMDRIAGMSEKELETSICNVCGDSSFNYESNIVTYSRKVFIPLTRLCRDKCHYCT
jgi:hypothetical protein